jgi:NTP pyrophosphatase (non-canonical NTP hydrolase)
MKHSLLELDKILQEFEQDYWVATDSKKGKTRHITLHITKLLGKLGSISEKWEHGFDKDANEELIKTDITPDLLMYALMLARLHNFDLEESFMKRLEVNKRKVGKWKKAGEIKKLPKF